MLNLLLKLKSLAPFAAVIVIIFSISYGLHYHNRYLNEQAKNLQLNQQLANAYNQINTQNTAIEQWKQEGAQLERKLRLTEQEAARRDEESQKRVDDIMHAPLSGDCQEAIDYGILMASKLS